jgi:hypothetical protein
VHDFEAVLLADGSVRYAYLAERILYEWGYNCTTLAIDCIDPDCVRPGPQCAWQAAQTRTGHELVVGWVRGAEHGRQSVREWDYGDDGIVQGEEFVYHMSPFAIDAQGRLHVAVTFITYGGSSTMPLTLLVVGE